MNIKKILKLYIVAIQQIQLVIQMVVKAFLLSCKGYNMNTDAIAKNKCMDTAIKTLIYAYIRTYFVLIFIAYCTDISIN